MTQVQCRIKSPRMHSDAFGCIRMHSDAFGPFAPALHLERFLSNKSEISVYRIWAKFPSLTFPAYQCPQGKWLQIRQIRQDTIH